MLFVLVVVRAAANQYSCVCFVVLLFVVTTMAKKINDFLCWF